MNRILVMARIEVEYFLLTGSWKLDGPSQSESWALISIWDSKELLGFKEIETLKSRGCQNCLSVKFADITSMEKFENIQTAYGDKIPKLFNDIDAHLIINFVDEIKDKVDVLVIHCAAGVSRSGAVGLFICRYLNMDEEKFRKENKGILPNFFILGVLNEVSGINSDYVKFWEQDTEMARKRIKLEGLKNLF